MFSLRHQNPDQRPPVEPRLFRDAMSRPAVSREFFLPLEQAWWDGGRFTLGRWASSAARPSVRGVRLQEAAPDSSGPAPERDTQRDLCSLVGSVSELRRVPELSGLVLSDETLVGRQQGPLPGKRVLFGLQCPANGRYLGDTPAAAECHRVLRRAIKRAGYILEHPREKYNPLTGFAGLRDWAAAVRLRRKPDPRRWLPLLLLPLLFFPWQCMQNLRNRPSLPGDAAASLKNDAKGGDADKGAGQKGPGDAGKGGGSGAPGDGKGGNGAGGPKNGNNVGKKPATPPGPPKPLPEEAGPPTTIPSKLARPVPSGTTFPAPNLHVPPVGSSRRYGAE
jgi:hypothetical protein